MLAQKFLKYKHGCIMILYGIFYLLAFRYLETRDVYIFHVVHTALDDKIPFLEGFIVPYLLWFPYVIMTVCWFVFRSESKTDYYRLISNLIMGMTVFLIVSWSYPNMLLLRPSVFPRENIFTSLVSWLYRTDTPTNVLPSIHVFNSLACHMAITSSPVLRERKAIRYGSLALTVSIILATMFLKQHSVIDVCLGSAMALLGHILFYTEGSLQTADQVAFAGSGKAGQRR